MKIILHRHSCISIKITTMILKFSDLIRIVNIIFPDVLSKIISDYVYDIDLVKKIIYKKSKHNKFSKIMNNCIYTLTNTYINY